MSIIIQKYLEDCTDPALTPEAKSQLMIALIPQSASDNSQAVASESAGSMPVVEVDRSRVDEILQELEKAGAQTETLTLLKFLIQTEIYYELQLSNDDQVIMALRYLETMGYDPIMISDCIQLLQTPPDEDIPNPGAFMELLSESLRVGKYQTLAMAVNSYLEECMAD